MPPVPVVEDPLLNAQLTTARQQSQQFRSQLEQSRISIGQSTRDFELEERIAADYKPLYEGGGMSRTQYLSQSQSSTGNACRSVYT